MEYEKCLVEVEEVLNHLDISELEKIPKDIIQVITENKDKNYTWSYDETKSLLEQELDRGTIAILSYLNMEYLLSDEQKALMEELHRFNEKKASFFYNKFKKEGNKND